METLPGKALYGEFCVKLPRADILNFRQGWEGDLAAPEVGRSDWPLEYGAHLDRRQRRPTVKESQRTESVSGKSGRLLDERLALAVRGAAWRNEKKETLS